MALFDFERSKDELLKQALDFGTSKLEENLLKVNPSLSLNDAKEVLKDAAEASEPIITTGKTFTGGDDPINRAHYSRGMGAMEQAIYQNFYGLNRFSGTPYAPLNRTSNGFVFFTRPRMYLSYDNITQVRTLTPMLTRNENGIMRALRAYLDPVGARQAGGHSSPMVNPYNPFIPLLSNNLLTLSGWPEMIVDTFTADAGIYKEEWSIADGFSRIFGTYELTANFRNIQGDPISWIFHFWTQYMLQIKEGVLNPRPEQLLDNEIDYDTRIYRLIMDKTWTYVEKIAACGAAFPVSNNMAQQFDYDVNKPISEGPDEISVTFRCMGADYNDPISLLEFNMTGELFDYRLRDQFRNQYYHQVKPEEALLMNHRAIPRINPHTMELEWWILKEEHAKMMSKGDTLAWLNK